MRITSVIAGLSGGGAERVCVNLANAWVACEQSATVLTVSHTRPAAFAIDPRVERRDLGWPCQPHSRELNAAAIAPVIRLIRHARCLELMGEIPFIALLRYAILETKPDVVVTHMTMTNVFVIAAMPETGVPVIAYEHTDTSRLNLPHWAGAREALYRYAAAVVAPDPVIAEWLAAGGASAFTIHNPLVAPRPYTVKRDGPRRRLVTLARLSSEKRIEFLLRSFASIAADFPEWDLEIYGVGPQQNFLEHLAEELAPERIWVRGFSTDNYGILAAADLYVSSSCVEGFGNAIWEALACGVPVVAMDAGPPVRALVRNGVDGLIVWENSMAALASALARLMGNDAERKAFAARAPEVIRRFSMESSLRKWDALLEKVTDLTPGSKN